MKFIILATIFLMTGSGSSSVKASEPIYCEDIKDKDKRYMCLAITTGDVIYCESIKDKDTRSFCRALVTKKSGKK